VKGQDPQLESSSGSAEQPGKWDPSVRPDTISTGLNVDPASLWFALQVRSRYEPIVAAMLRCQGYTWFLPTYKCRRQWSDRMKESELALFPGYLFCKFNPQHRLPILKIPGLISIVGIGKTPFPVDEVEITALRNLVNCGLPCQPWPYLKIGQRVRIKYGALSGLEGILIASKSHYRIVVSVTLLQRSVATEIDSAWVDPIVEPLSSPPGSHMSGPLSQSNARVKVG
jgi:transcription antitermination factor NusG